MKTFVHIGYHKNATTFFQKVLFLHHPQLTLINRMEAREVLLRVGSLHFDSVKAKEWLRDHKLKAEPLNKHIVLSDEEFSGNIHTGGGGGYVAKEIADRLYAVDPEAHIIVFVRNQFDIIESAYKQYIKKGGTLSIRKYLFNDGLNHRFPQFSFEHFEYDRLISYYMKLFGRDQVHVFLYEDLKRDTEKFMNTFCSELNLSLFKDINKLKNTIANPSYSFISIYLARLTNHVYGTDPINRRVIVDLPVCYKLCKKFYHAIDKTKLIRKLDSNFSFLNRELYNYIENRYSNSNKILSDLLKTDVGAYGYPVIK